MSARLMVLGIVASQPEVHGYYVYRELVNWRAESWNSVLPGSIYHAISQLEKEDLLEKRTTEKSSSGPEKTCYAITEDGRREFLRLIKESLISYDPETFAAGLAFMRHLPREQVIQLAKERLDTYHQICSFMRTLARKDDMEHPSQHPAIIDSWTAVFDATMTWQKDFIAQLEDGAYIFKESTA